MLLAVLLLVLGVAYPLVLNGQTFTNSIVGIVLLGSALAICIVQDRRARSNRRRLFIRFIAGIAAFIIPILIVLLPGNYQFQKGFNRVIQCNRERIEQSLETVDVGERGVQPTR